MRQALIVPAKGIGDGLLMMIASHQLLRAGFQVTTYHPALRELASWFPGHQFIDQLPSDLTAFTPIIVQNDHSSKMHHWKAHFPQALLFYPGYCPQKNPPFASHDHLFNPSLSMAENIAIAIARVLDSPPSLDNGITPPLCLRHRLHSKRVLIHPYSSSPEKNWLTTRYLKLKENLIQKGFQPLFVMSPEERSLWGDDAPLFNTLDDLANYVYESGYLIGNDSMLGHLASNLNIPTLIIANDQKRMQLWRPGWLPGEVVTPYHWIPNYKFFRIRQKKWKELISTKRVLSAFENLLSP